MTTEMYNVGLMTKKKALYVSDANSPVLFEDESIPKFGLAQCLVYVSNLCIQP
jgi:hypothetical protein